MLRTHELPLLRSLLFEIERHFINHRGKDSFTMSVVTTNDNQIRLRPSGVDKDGVAVPAAGLTGLTVTADPPTVASVAPDADNPGTFLVTALPSAEPAVGARTVVITTTDPATGFSVQTSIEFDPGLEAGLSVAAEIVPPAAKTATEQAATEAVAA